MNTLAHAGPAPWVLFFPLVWAAVIVTVVTVLRRTGGRGRRWSGPWAGYDGSARDGGGYDENSPIALLGHRFAAGEIDEDEYWRRLTVLEEQFGRVAHRKGGAA
ncbi:SHOCT domain-containing protein [Streptomyces sp. NPDC048604]|uniref:SHOCT domain-containing protein n=1 Tax=Streptomyces sp. NPDC048604 TaxID=3365578 RepID=UPI003711BEC6